MPRDIIDLILDAHSVRQYHPTVAEERRTAITDLLRENLFMPASGLPGPYALRLGIEDGRLLLEITSTITLAQETIRLAVRPLRGIIRDYFAICASHYQGLATLAPTQLEAIDMGRRGVHNEGSELLRDALHPKVQIDLPTARRLFTLVCVLHIRNEAHVLA
jgi:uncharacterized protein (UPF0262 family)